LNESLTCPYLGISVSGITAIKGATDEVCVGGLTKVRSERKALVFMVRYLTENS
jgi:hypothetical protein